MFTEMRFSGELKMIDLVVAIAYKEENLPVKNTKDDNIRPYGYKVVEADGTESLEIYGYKSSSEKDVIPFLSTQDEETLSSLIRTWLEKAKIKKYTGYFDVDVKLGFKAQISDMAWFNKMLVVEPYWLEIGK